VDRLWPDNNTVQWSDRKTDQRHVDKRGHCTFQTIQWLPIESKTGQWKDHNSGERACPNTDQMPDHKTGQMKVHNTDPILDQTTGQRTDQRPRPYNGQWTYRKTQVTGQIRRQIKGPVTYRSEDLPSDTRWMDKYKACGNKTEKWHGTRQEKLVAQGGKRHLSKKDPCLYTPAN
jgi:hypothetical protein